MEKWSSRQSEEIKANNWQNIYAQFAKQTFTGTKTENWIQTVLISFPFNKNHFDGFFLLLYLDAFCYKPKKSGQSQ